MIDWQGKRYWIIGASEGLGREVALCLSRAGAEVIVSSRTADRLNALVEELPGKATALPLDVTDRAAVGKAASEVGEIDGLVYLAGVYWPMKAGEWDAERAEEMAVVNYLGASRAVGAVIGGMVDRGVGHIVLTGSLAGYRGLSGMIGYGASKAAVMSLAESLRADLRKTDIKVQVVNPGFIKARMTEKNDFKMPFIMEPEDAGREYFEHMNDDAFKKSFPVLLSWAVRLCQFLPDWVYYPMFGAK